MAFMLGFSHHRRHRGVMAMMATLLLLLALLAVVLLPSVSAVGSSSSSTLPSPLLKSFFNMDRVQHPSADDLLRFLGDDLYLDRPRGHSALVTDFRNAAIRAMSKWARTALAQATDKPAVTTPSLSDSPSSEFPYWRFVPLYVGSLIPDQPAITWTAPCFQQNSGRLTSIANSTHFTVTLTLEDASSLFCSDMYALATLEGYVIKTFFFRGEETFTWETADNVTAAELHDIAVRGVRVFVFSDSAVDTASELATTLELFVSLETQGVPTATAELNVDFMAKYPQFKMTERSTQQVALNESDIQSGDFFGVVRLDGLDPMLAWAMGSQTGHVTMALWIGNELYVVESTTNSSYWPVNGVQRTPYSQWIEQARAAGYQVVHAPLTAEARAAFNATAALEFFESVEGVDYGYQVLLWTWLDTVQDNFPCLPPDYTGCLTASHMQVLFGYIDRAMPSVGDILFKQAWNKRVNTTDLSFAEVLQVADQLGIPADVLPTHVEQDSWTYATTRYNEPWEGPAMVCCVFVCRMWKAAGVFGADADSINCAEQTNSDLYGLSVVQAPDPRPPQCVAADPANPLCQLEGAYTLQLTQFATHAPYPHMDETCPTLAPDYKRVDGC